MAVDAAQIRELWPSTFPGVAGEVPQRVAEGNHLPHCPGPRAVGLVGSPVQWHSRRVVVELEGQKRMTGGDQLMVDFAGRISHVTRQANGGACGKASQIDHVPLDRLSVRPVRLHVLRSPTTRGTMTGLALHAILDINVTGDQMRWDTSRMTSEADRFLIRLPLQTHVARDVNGTVVEEDVVCLCVAIVGEPCVVLIVQNARSAQRMDCSMAPGGRA